MKKHSSLIALVGLFFIATVGCAKPHYLANKGKSNVPAFRNQDGVACDARFQPSGYCLSVIWEKTPNETDYGSFVFKTYRPNLAEQNANAEDLSAAMFVRLFMPSMGHGSSPVAVTKIDTDTYRASNVFFSMHGQWQIIFEVKTGNKINDAAVLPIQF